jgi:transposase
MTDHLSILEIALTIRPYLSKLLGVEAGEQMRQQLDQLLHQAQAGESVEDVIWDLLTDARATRTWITQFQQTTQKGSNQLPGQISAITAPQFKCPLCDYSWSRQRSGLLTPLCPNHNEILQRV